MVHHDGARVADAQSLEEPELQRLGLLEAIRGDGIDHGNAERLHVSEEGLGVEEDPGMPARVRRGARAVDDHRVRRAAVVGIEGVVRVIDLLPGQASPSQLADEAGRPLGVLVQDADRGYKPRIHIVFPFSTGICPYYLSREPGSSLLSWPPECR